MSRLSVAVLTCGQPTRDLRSLSKGLSFVFLRVSGFRFVTSTDLGPHSSNSPQGGAKFPYAYGVQASVLNLVTRSSAALI